MPAYRQEMATLRRLKREHTGNAEALLDPWDVAYYGHQLYETQADDQKGKLDSYLRADHVIQGMFDIFSGLYGLTITERPTACIASGSGKPHRKAPLKYGIPQSGTTKSATPPPANTSDPSTWT